MPLLDHFRPPLHPRRSWESLHAMWTTRLVEDLNERLLPEDFFAEAQTHIGSRVEIDVATFERGGEDRHSRKGGLATATVQPKLWAPPKPDHVLPAVFPDTFEVHVFGMNRGGQELVAVIELVSPGNKDRPEERRGFATKCAGYLYRGISLIIMDVVTTYTSNLHDEMLKVMLAAGEPELTLGDSLYAVAYRPLLRNEKAEIDIWSARFKLGEDLPTLPMALSGIEAVPVDFESAYSEACRRLRLP